MKYVGITETYDPCFVPDWETRLLEANVVISKELSDEMVEKLLIVQDRVIFHHTVTGQGGTVLEPHVKTPEHEFEQFVKLVDRGFDTTHYVLRLDPIVLLNKECQDNIYKVLDMWSGYAKEHGIVFRCRVSVVDLYPHAVLRMRNKGVTLLWKNFKAPMSVFRRTEEILGKYTEWLYFESCAETELTADFIDKLGCVSYKDLSLLHVNGDSYGQPVNKQRDDCQCLAKRQILGTIPRRCPHGCLYCFWKD